MKGYAAVLLAAATAVAADASVPITVSGNAFFQGTNRFFMRGVDYQPGGSSDIADPLADGVSSSCERDIKNFQDLGLNTIRVYTVDNSASHDTCMNALSSAGIYLILDVNSPEYSLNRVAPAASYNPTYLQNIFATIDAFSKYNNTMAFFSGNEVINETTASTITAPYIKAVTRDMKEYIAARNYRQIPVGYSGADVTTNRYETAQFLNCGADAERSDFFAFNDYSWCDPSSFQTSGWDAKVALFANYSLPIFLSEYGCNTNTRTFQEVAALYNTEMTGVYSGGLVYEYSQETSDYGLGTIDGSTYTPNQDYAALKTALQNTSNPTGDAGYRSNSGGAMSCPTASSTWLWGNDSLPVIPSGATQYMTKGAGTAPGLKGNNGDGSQNSPGESTAFATVSGSIPSSTGSSSSSSASSSKAAAGSLTIPELTVVPFICGLVVLVSSLLGGGAFLL